MNPRLKRHLSLSARLPRRDFWPYPVCFVLCIAFDAWHNGMPGAVEQGFLAGLVGLLLAILLLAASKRCRDANVAPWMAIAFTLIPFGLIVLMLLHPTRGSNEFGSDPRAPPKCPSVGSI